MTKAFLLAGLFSLFLALPSYGAQVKYQSIFPENGLWIDAEDKAAGGLTEVQFNAVIDKINTLYSPAVKAKGGRLFIQKLWTDGTVNAYAARPVQYPGIWLVAMFGGLARTEGMTPDAYSLVVCHELSHHLGGSPIGARPKYDPYKEYWPASIEGQADYIGAMKCMRDVFKSDDNISIVKTLNVDPLVTKMCNNVYKDPKTAAICVRTSMAGKALMDILAAISYEKSPPSFATPDRHVVSRIDPEHPLAQCRLDTIFAGALCNKDSSSPVSNSDVTVGTCNTSKGDKIGVRPLCWYKP